MDFKGKGVSDGEAEETRRKFAKVGTSLTSCQPSQPTVVVENLKVGSFDFNFTGIRTL